MNTRISRYWPIPLRVLLGIAFLVHGVPKLSGAGHASLAGMLGQNGFPIPGVMAWVATAVEVLGGLALIGGAFIPLATALLVIEMLVAMFTVQFGMPGAEVSLLYVAGLLALFLGGPGPLSVDENVFHGFKSLWDRIRHRPSPPQPHAA